MKVFKTKTTEELSIDDFSIGDIIVTKSIGEPYNFELSVYDGLTFKKENEKSKKHSLPTFREIAGFFQLKEAIGYGHFLEEGIYKYEYYVQMQEFPNKEGLDNMSMEAMGLLGWELSSIHNELDSNEAAYIYKRKLVG